MSRRVLHLPVLMVLCTSLSCKILDAKLGIPQAILVVMDSCGPHLVQDMGNAAVACRILPLQNLLTAHANTVCLAASRFRNSRMCTLPADDCRQQTIAAFQKQQVHTPFATVSLSQLGCPGVLQLILARPSLIYAGQETVLGACGCAVLEPSATATGTASTRRWRCKPNAATTYTSVFLAASPGGFFAGVSSGPIDSSTAACSPLHLWLSPLRTGRRRRH